VKRYLELAKFRLSALVVVTSGAGFICTGLPIDYSLLTTTCLGTALCAASAGTFNQIIEKERDGYMKRTTHRPLPSGKMSIQQAGLFGVLTGLSGTSLLLLGTNPVVAMLGAGNIVLYSGIYTYSKRYTEWNTWIGALVGAVPPLMGWSAATGGDLSSAEPMILASILFLWQFPHFFALSWMHREDYSRGQFQMVSCNDPAGTRTSRVILEYSTYLAALPIMTSISGHTSYMFAFEGLCMNAYLLYLCSKFHRDRTNANARRVFLCSLWYLPLLLTCFIFHSSVWDSADIEDTLNIDELKGSIIAIKAKLRGLCIHEAIHSSSDLCPKVVSDKVVEKADSMTITTSMHANGLDDTITSDVHAIDADLSGTYMSCSSDKEVGVVEGLVQSSCSDGPEVVVVPYDDNGTDSDS